MTTDLTPSPVRLHAVAGKGQPDPTPELEQLYRGFEQELLVPLWTQIGDLMPRQPQSKAVPHLWRWDRLKALAAQAGAIVPVGRGGERRAIALANPALGGRPFATPTLWAAIQYLMPGEDAPEHRHTQHAFRFVVEGEGVWTVVNGDAVRMSRGDFLPQAGWNWHAHHNAATEPMAWIDGLDIPFSYYTESQFFEVGREKLPPAERTTADLHRNRIGHHAQQPAHRQGLPRLRHFAPQHTVERRFQHVGDFAGLDVAQFLMLFEAVTFFNQPVVQGALFHRQAPFRHLDDLDISHVQASITLRTAASMRSTLGIQACSSTGENGTGVCGGVTMMIGALS